eukprot:SAG31_NODE_713_length_12651_cov_180.009481_14_plen_176_part_00
MNPNSSQLCQSVTGPSDEPRSRHPCTSSPTHLPLCSASLPPPWLCRLQRSAAPFGPSISPALLLRTSRQALDGSTHPVGRVADDLHLPRLAVLHRLEVVQLLHGANASLLRWLHPDAAASQPKPTETNRKKRNVAGLPAVAQRRWGSGSAAEGGAKHRQPQQAPQAVRTCHSGRP